MRRDAQSQRTGTWLVAISAVVAVSMASVLHGQHQGHDTAAAPDAAQVTACAAAQDGIARTIDAALKRIEAARQTNSAAAMRAATFDMQSVLLELRTQLEPCAAMPRSASSPAHQAPPSSAPADPHAGHTSPDKR